jgi:hypothetical protein
MLLPFWFLKLVIFTTIYGQPPAVGCYATTWKGCQYLLLSASFGTKMLLKAFTSNVYEYQPPTRLNWSSRRLLYHGSSHL